MKTDNELIAEFIGYTDTTPRYQSSWGWLMLVVLKIEDMGFNTSFKTTYVRINPKSNYYTDFIVKVVTNSDGWYAYRVVDYGLVSEDLGHGSGHLSKQEMIYKAIVEFIKWYNLNKIFKC